VVRATGHAQLMLALAMGVEVASIDAPETGTRPLMELGT
jgi:hypothetical protein